MIVLTIHCICVKNTNYVTILKLLFVLLTDINFWQMSECQFTIVISVKKKSKNIFRHRYICRFYVEHDKNYYLLNNSFVDGDRKKSLVKAYINYAILQLLT